MAFLCSKIIRLQNGMLVCFHRDDDDDEHREAEQQQKKSIPRKKKKSFMRFKDSWNVKFFLSARFNNLQQNRFKLKACQLHSIDTANKTSVF